MADERAHETPRRATRAADTRARAGIGLRAPHFRELVEREPDIGWLEVHSENYFGAGGAPLRSLEAARARYPLSLHGVGLSLGSTDPLDQTHLRRLRDLAARVEPMFVSDHLCWCSHGGTYLNDLLPLPFTEEAVVHAAERIARAQDFLGRELLVENVSSYLRFRHSTMTEWEFVRAVAERAGCGLLLDVNNVYVSARNHGFDPREYLRGIPRGRVREIHLAGHAVNRYPEGDILIDHHGDRVAPAVWALYARALERFGPLPTLIEWDTDLPALDVLLDEAATAERVLGKHDARAA